MSTSHFISRIFRFLSDAGLKAFVVFLLFAGGFYAFATITWPPNIPGNLTGVVGVYVGATTGTHNGSLTDYETANSLCSTPFTGSHICTGTEMINSYNHVNNASPINSASGYMWINNSSTGNLEKSMNDCQGWKSADSKVFGSIWHFANKAPSLTPCDEQLKFACCL